MSTNNPMWNKYKYMNDGMHMEEQQGISNDTARNMMLVLILLFSMTIVVYMLMDVMKSGASETNILIFAGGALLGFLTTVAAKRFPQHALITALVYAVCQGVVFGSLSYLFDAATGYEGSIEILLLPMFMLMAMIMLSMTYISGIVKRVSKNGRKSFVRVAGAVGGVSLMYTAAAMLQLLGFDFPFTHDRHIIAIAVESLVIVFSAMMISSDLHHIETKLSRDEGHATWYGSLSILVALVWMYREMWSYGREISKKS